MQSNKDQTETGCGTNMRELGCGNTKTEQKKVGCITEVAECATDMTELEIGSGTSVAELEVEGGNYDSVATDGTGCGNTRPKCVECGDHLNQTPLWLNVCDSLVQQYYTAPACYKNTDYNGPAKTQGGDGEVWRMPKQIKDKLELCWGQLGIETKFGRGKKRKRGRNKVLKKEKEKDRNQDRKIEDVKFKEVEKQLKATATKNI